MRAISQFAAVPLNPIPILEHFRRSHPQCEHNIHLAPVVQTSDSAIHRINHYPADSVIDFRNTYPLDSDLSCG